MQGSAIAFLKDGENVVIDTACCGDRSLDLGQTPVNMLKEAALAEGWDEVTEDPAFAWLMHEAKRQFSTVGATSARLFRFTGQRKLL